MQTVAGEKELFQACEIIFGSELDISREFLEYLQPSGIKSAYRKRALETHPDRVIQNDQALLRQHHELFHSVQLAYENLSTFLSAREKGYRLPPVIHPASTGSPSRAKSSSQATRNKQERPRRPQAKTSQSFNGKCGEPFFFWNTDKLYQGELPNRRLLFGHFLYYSGLINWRAIIQALLWQRSERPRLGEIGYRFGLLSEAEVSDILRNRQILQPFGQAALELGFLTQAQIQLLVNHQKRLQKKIGEFFLERGIFTPFELQRSLKKYQEHNALINAQAYRRDYRR